MIGSTELIIVVGVGLVLFGASAIPKFARSLGQAKHEFEKGIKQVESEESDKDTSGSDTSKLDNK